MGTFVRRLVTLTLVWLLATAALTYAASRRIGAPPAPATTTTTVAAPAMLVVPSVVHQPYVFAEGTLGDAGFAWHVAGAVHGFAANLVVSQTPAPGTRVIDTGAPLIVLRLSHPAGASQDGLPSDSSPVAGTALKLASLASSTATTEKTATLLKKPVVAKKPVTAAKKTAPLKKAAPVKKAPAHRWPQHRPAAFVVAGARREPLDEMPLTDRAEALLRFIQSRPKPTDANVRYWLYQHAWVVAGARMGWWHGAAALRTLETVDQRVWKEWGIGERSDQVARQALAFTEAKS